ncbi:unnamed protein product [Sphagnum balticum]
MRYNRPSRYRRGKLSSRGDKSRKRSSNARAVHCFADYSSLLGVVMVLLILLHAPKGEGMGWIGGSANMFSSKRGAEGGLDRLTWGVCGAFVLICNGAWFRLR